MAKIWVTHSSSGSGIPFLPGILTNSLTDAGLSFNDANKTSCELRQPLAEVGEMRRDGLRQRTEAYLEAGYDDEIKTQPQVTIGICP